MEFLDTNQIKIDPPKRPKKMTGTRFATVLGLNAWDTPFSAWCEITRTYQEPFEDTVYTIAGKVIEPKIIKYLHDTYFLDIKDPTAVYGKDYFKKTRGDFFKNHDILGGMWDAIGDNFVVEIKTTKRAEDWKDEIPLYYKLQASLYAYLLNMDNVIVTVSFLEEEDYIKPENFIPSVDNTVTYEFKISEEYEDFENEYIKPALQWWKDHVETGMSPVFDEKKDADILKELRTNKPEITDEEIIGLLKRADELQAKVDGMKKHEKELDEVKGQIKEYMRNQLRDGDNRVIIESGLFQWSLLEVVSNRVDASALKKAGMYEQYCKPSVSYKLTPAPKEV